MPSAHPTHIDIPAHEAPQTGEDGLATSPRSSARPAPSRGILKNPLRRPSYTGNEDQVARTDDERQEAQEQTGRTRTGGK
jgi:protein phosphatase inhibitor 2